VARVQECYFPLTIHPSIHPTPGPKVDYSAKISMFFICQIIVNFVGFIFHFVRVFIFEKVGALTKNPKEVWLFRFDRNLNINETEEVLIKSNEL
jgi:hypothetical protein